MFPISSHHKWRKIQFRFVFEFESYFSNASNISVPCGDFYLSLTLRILYNRIAECAMCSGTVLLYFVSSSLIAIGFPFKMPQKSCTFTIRLAIAIAHLYVDVQCSNMNSSNFRNVVEYIKNYLLSVYQTSPPRTQHKFIVLGSVIISITKTVFGRKTSPISAASFSDASFGFRSFSPNELRFQLTSSSSFHLWQSTPLRCLKWALRFAIYIPGTVLRANSVKQ